MRLRIAEAEMAARCEKLDELLSPCRLCPHHCMVDRRWGERGRCGVGAGAKVASFGPHFGEEPPLVGRRGSGTVFFSGCNLSCVFCQNYTISQLGEGQQVSTEHLAEIFLGLARRGCHNINLVTPTHQAPVIVSALALARQAGLELPIVWNCGGYESPEVLRLLDGIVDIYMPDAKYGDDAAAARYSGAPEYATNLEAVLCEMHRQVGDLVIEEGIAQRGMLIRHLVLPSGIAASARVFTMIASHLGRNTYLNVMQQYRPCYRADEYPELACRLSPSEYAEAVRSARELGLHRGLPAFENGT